jgi:hypothetical protein
MLVSNYQPWDSAIICPTFYTLATKGIQEYTIAGRSTVDLRLEPIAHTMCDEHLIRAYCRRVKGPEGTSAA